VWRVAQLARGRVVRVMPAEEEMIVLKGAKGGGRRRSSSGGVGEEAVNFPGWAIGAEVPSEGDGGRLVGRRWLAARGGCQRGGRLCGAIDGRDEPIELVGVR
jgi:hypothetical protein